MTRQSIQDRILTASQNSGQEESLTVLPPAPRTTWRAVRYIALAGAFAAVVAGAVVLSFRFYPALGEFVAGTASAQAQAPAESKPEEAGTAGATRHLFKSTPARLVSAPAPMSSLRSGRR